MNGILIKHMYDFRMVQPRGIITTETRTATELLTEAVDMIEVAAVIGDDAELGEAFVSEYDAVKERLIGWWRE